MLGLISRKYNGNIILKEPLEDLIAEKDFLPIELHNILKQTNGILEGMINPNTGQFEAISWIVYSYNMILEESEFYKDNYSIAGVVFSDDGAGNPYYMKSDAKIYYYEIADAEENLVANSLIEFFK